MSSTVVPEPLGAFLRAVRRVPVLAPAECERLAIAVEAGLLAAERLETVTDLTADDRSDLRRLVADGEHARTTIVMANLRLVLMLARRQKVPPGQLFDVIQNGTVGLIQAVERYDYRRGFRFSTYAVIWIHQAMTQAHRAQGRAVRIPVAVAAVLPEVARARAELQQSQQCEPTTHQLAAALDVLPERLEELLASVMPPSSLDAGDDLGGSTATHDAAIRWSGRMVADDVADTMLPGYLDELLRSLDERKRRIISLRFGLDDGRPRTLDEVASDVGVSRERVRLILAETLAELRETRTVQELRAYLG